MLLTVFFPSPLSLPFYLFPLYVSLSFFAPGRITNGRHRVRVERWPRRDASASSNWTRPTETTDLASCIIGPSISLRTDLPRFIARRLWTERSWNLGQSLVYNGGLGFGDSDGFLLCCWTIYEEKFAVSSNNWPRGGLVAYLEYAKCFVTRGAHFGGKWYYESVERRSRFFSELFLSLTQQDIFSVLRG